MFESAVDGFGGAVARAWVVEECEDVMFSSFQGPSQAAYFDERARNF